jgi:hypothetical protein
MYIMREDLHGCVVASGTRAEKRDLSRLRLEKGGTTHQLFHRENRLQDLTENASRVGWSMEREDQEGRMKKIGVSLIMIYVMGIFLVAKSFARLRTKSW